VDGSWPGTRAARPTASCDEQNGATVRPTAFCMASDAHAARLDALEARVAQLSAANALLTERVSQLADENEKLWQWLTPGPHASGRLVSLPPPLSLSLSLSLGLFPSAHSSGNLVAHNTRPSQCIITELGNPHRSKELAPVAGTASTQECDTRACFLARSSPPAVLFAK
jgi:hypothetical protein